MHRHHNLTTILTMTMAAAQEAARRIRAKREPHYYDFTPEEVRVLDVAMVADHIDALLKLRREVVDVACLGSDQQPCWKALDDLVEQYAGAFERADTDPVVDLVADRLYSLFPEECALYAAHPDRGEYRGFSALHDLCDANEQLRDAVLEFTGHDIPDDPEEAAGSTGWCAFANWVAEAYTRYVVAEHGEQEGEGYSKEEATKALFA